jgi:hypothetical protein
MAIQLSGSLAITGSLVATGQIIAQTLNVQQVTSSIVYSSGSNIFGNSLSNTQIMTGSVSITGSLSVNGTSSTLGTGTTNYLPKFTGASTIGDSLVYDNGTVVGIATTALIADGLLPIQINAGASGQAYFASNNNGGYGLLMGYDNANGYARIRNVSNTALTFETNNSEKMRLTNSGNLGLGVTPSAWDTSTNVRVLQMNAGSLWGFSTTAFLMVQNSFSNTSGVRTYVNNGFASEYEQASGQHIWKIAPSGTAGNAISFAQVMTLDASGRLGVGTTSPSERLQVDGSNVMIKLNAATDTFAQLGYYENGTLKWNLYNNYVNDNFQIGNSGGTYFTLASTGAATFSSSVGINGVGPTYPLYVKTGTNQRARFVDNGGLFQFAVLNDAESGYSDMSIGNSAIVVKSAGNVGIGTTSPTGYGPTLQIAGTSAQDASFVLGDGSGTTTNRYLAASPGSSGNFHFGTNSGDILFKTGLNPGTSVGSERMRITSGGELLWNLTGDSAADLSSGGVLFRNNSQKYIQIATGIDTDGLLMAFYKKNGAGITNTGTISTSGNSTLYNTTSDYRLKEDFKDYNALDIIDKLKTYDFKWKGSNTRDFGMIAHELQEILPTYVNGKKDAINEDGTIKTQGVDYSKIVPVLIKAIQEQQAQIEQLKNK